MCGKNGVTTLRGGKVIAVAGLLILGMLTAAPGSASAKSASFSVGVTIKAPNYAEAVDLCMRGFEAMCVVAANTKAEAEESFEEAFSQNGNYE